MSLRIVCRQEDWIVSAIRNHLPSQKRSKVHGWSATGHKWVQNALNEGGSNSGLYLKELNGFHLEEEGENTASRKIAKHTGELRLLKCFLQSSSPDNLKNSGSSFWHYNCLYHTTATTLLETTFLVKGVFPPPPHPPLPWESTEVYSKPVFLIQIFPR